MLDSLDWLRRQMPPESLCVLMDQYGTYTTEAMAIKAEGLRIELIWIPKGATGKYQPLDRRTFGALKSKGKAKWRHEFAEHYGMGCTREVGAELLLQSWSELWESVVTSGWDYGEELGEEEESDDSGDEFELRMETDTDDEDFRSMQNGIGEEEEDGGDPACMSPIIP
jgi:hypothetical protein